MSEEYKEGIYFNMPEDEYHGLPFFSRSFSEEEFISPEDAWVNSARNPDREERESTPAMELGKALHSMILEPKLFKALYVKKPSFADYPDMDILDSTADIKVLLKEVGEKLSGTKAEMIARVEPYIDPDKHVIWGNVMKAFNQNVADHGLRVLTDGNQETLSGIAESLERRPDTKSILEEAMSEVTIIWIDKETGIKCKCRLDSVRIEAIIELKSFSLQRKKNLYDAMCDAIMYERYYMQYYVYHSALKNVINKINKKQAIVSGDVDAQWLKKFLAVPDKQYFWLFARTQAPYQCKAIEGRRAFAKGATENAYHHEARNLWETILQSHKRTLDEFGDERPIDDKVELLDDAHVPNIMYQGYRA